MIIDAMKLAVDNLFHRKMRSWLTMIGIFIGIAAVVSLISLSDGLNNAINDQFSSVGSDKLTIQGRGGGFGPPGANAVGKVTTDDVKLLKGVPGVKLVTGRIIRAVSYGFKTESDFAYIVTLPEDNEERKVVLTANKYKMHEGAMITSNSQSGVVLGYTLAYDTFTKDVRVGQDVELNGQSFTVTGIMEKRGIIFFDMAIVINEKPARELLDDDETYSMIMAQSDSGVELNALADRITRTMRNDRDQKVGEEDFTVQTPEQMLQTVGTILTIVSVIVIGIAGISLVVGGVGIMNTMYTAVLERTREIGIMKAIGARNSDIFIIFLVESGLLGIVGGTIGILLGFGMGKLVEFAAFVALGPGLVKADVSLGLMLSALAFSFLVGAASGVTPAYQASKMKPVDSLRYE